MMTQTPSNPYSFKFLFSTSKLRKQTQENLPHLYNISNPIETSKDLQRFYLLVWSKKVAVWAIIGIPSLKQWGRSITLNNNQLPCRNLKEAFPLIYESVQNGLLSNSHFTPTNFYRTTQPHVIVLTAKLFTGNKAFKIEMYNYTDFTIPPPTYLK